MIWFFLSLYFVCVFVYVDEWPHSLNCSVTHRGGAWGYKIVDVMECKAGLKIVLEL